MSDGTQSEANLRKCESVGETGILRPNAATLLISVWSVLGSKHLADFRGRHLNRVDPRSADTESVCFAPLWSSAGAAGGSR